ncbi:MULTISPECIES: hypothetical protein [Gammaproteobacteria]|uniref:hypothetical protein n=1 Tax=Gammaproteobacteria TaxID=1236 RepID=UPI000DCFA341|nr:MULTISPECIES: hypothetical protein [Gammaproteobacteria]RTE85475.1 hypothetical protein DQX04_11255 [Aliidiomarina sp. B3213]TCZ89442.1 hypothetical protein EYQ95_11175 [Lysobacter sp. N42]
MKKIYLTLLLCILISGCRSTIPIERDSSTGYFPTIRDHNIAKQEDVELDRYKKLVLVPDMFIKEMLLNVNYFENVITYEELELFVMDQGLSNKIPSPHEMIGLINLYNHYGPFLIMSREGGLLDGYLHVGLTLMDVKQEEILFRSLKRSPDVRGDIDYQWAPVFNAFIDYAESYSASYSRMDSLQVEEGVDVD